MSKPIEVPNEIYQSIENIKKNGLKNYKEVLNALESKGDKTTADWMHNNMKMYLQSEIYGMTPEEGNELDKKN